MSRTLVLVQHGKRPAIRELQSLLRRHTAYPSPLVVALTREVQIRLAAEGLDSRCLDVYSRGLDHKAIAKQALVWVQRWPNLPIFEGKSFKQMVSYKGVSLWWFVRVGLYHDLIQHVQQFFSLSNLFQEEEPERIVLIGDSALGEAIQHFGPARNMPFVLVQVRMGLFGRLLSQAGRYFQRALQALVMLARYVQGKRRYRLLQKGYEATKSKVLILTDAISWQQVTDPDTGRKKDSDAQVGWVLDRLIQRGRVDVLPLDTTRHLGHSTRTFMDKGFPYVPLEVFSMPFRARWAAEQVRCMQALASTWETLRDSKAFRESLYLDDVFLWPLLRSDFEQYFALTFPGAARNIALARDILQEISASVVFLTAEYGAGVERAFVAAGQLEGVPTVAAQHGMIGPLHGGYMYGPGEIQPLVCPIPDRTAVFGPYFQRMLVEKGGYPPERVVVTGQARTDVIAARERIYSRQRVFSELGLDDQEKLLLFASQPLADRQEYTMTAQALIQAMSELPDCFLVIKLHPGEVSGQTYQDFAQELDVHNYMVLGKVDLYSFLNACDVLLTVSSTVASEAILFDKPVVLLNLKYRDVMGYLEKGVALGVFQADAVGQTVREVLEEEQVVERLQKRRVEFVREHYYAVDGQSAARLASLIEQIASEAVTSAREPLG